MSDTIRVLNVGAGFMASLHAKAYEKLDGVENVGIVTRSIGSSEKLASELSGDIPRFTDFDEALEKTSPTAVAISTYTDSHYHYVSTALNKGLDVFVEKPLAETMEESQELFDLANRVGKKLYVGYILMTHPSWNKFTEIAHDLGKPLAGAHLALQRLHALFLGGAHLALPLGAHLLDESADLGREGARQAAHKELLLPAGLLPLGAVGVGAVVLAEGVVHLLQHLLQREALDGRVGQQPGGLLVEVAPPALAPLAALRQRALFQRAPQLGAAALLQMLHKRVHAAVAGAEAGGVVSLSKKRDPASHGCAFMPIIFLYEQVISHVVHP